MSKDIAKALHDFAAYGSQAVRIDEVSAVLSSISAQLDRIGYTLSSDAEGNFTVRYNQLSPCPPCLVYAAVSLDALSDDIHSAANECAVALSRASGRDIAMAMVKHAGAS